MAMTVTFQLLAALANASAAAQAQAQAHAPRDVATGFFDYCDQGSLTWYPTSDQQAIEADCSTTGDPVYFESWLDLNYCFGNDNGTMALQIRGDALDSCTCDMGAQIAGCRPNCASTKIQCTCDDEVGRTKTNSLDLNDYIGLGSDDDGHLVLLCYDAETETLVKGTFTECTQYGITTDCS